MQKLEINKVNATKAYNLADANTKIILEELFGRENLIPQKITDIVKTYEDACEQIGIDPDFGISCSKSGVWKEIESISAYAKLIVIAQALNQGWQPDWSDTTECKYVPWFKEKSGFGLAYDGYDVWDTNTNFGSRLCFKNRELAEYAATQFAGIYKDFLTIKK
jgi:hypothetical protein